MTVEILGFYTGNSPDDKGRYIEDILAFTDEELECTHDYIQWLFPNEIPSGCRGAPAPLLTEPDCRWFNTHPIMELNVHKVLRRMYEFYGFLPHLNETMLTQKDDFYKSKNWYNTQNHNFLRLTRMIKFLRLIGYIQEADGLFDALALVYAQNPLIVGRDTLTFWLNAANIEPMMELE